MVRNRASEATWVTPNLSTPLDYSGFGRIVGTRLLSTPTGRKVGGLTLALRLDPTLMGFMLFMIHFLRWLA